jgi:glycerol uptake facilitator-like aquaporin
MLFYGGAQFLGALTGVAVAAHVLRGALGNAAVHYAVTAPGVYGDVVAFVAEVMVSFVLMTAILLSRSTSISLDTRLTLPVLWLPYVLCSKRHYREAVRTPPEVSHRPFSPATGTLFGSISLHRRSGCWLQPRLSCSSVVALAHFAPSCITQIINVVYFFMDIEHCFGCSGKAASTPRCSSTREPSAERMS